MRHATSPQPTPRAQLPSAADNYETLVALTEGHPIAVFLDYDGVLTPIVAHPDLAILSPETRAVLTELATVTTVAVVSGRDVNDVRSKVLVPGIFYAGSHGFDIIDPAGSPVEDETLDRFAIYLGPLNDAAEILEARLRDVPGAQVERKRFAIAIHYRRVRDEDYPLVEAAVTETVPQVPLLRLATGKKVFELRPDFDWDKGQALLWLLAELGLDDPHIVPIYLGDDTTDEDAFRVIRDTGVGIVVGRDGAPSLARYALDDTDQVRAFLSRLASGH